MGKTRHGPKSKAGPPKAAAARVKNSKPAKAEPRLMLWRELREYLEAEGFGHIGRAAFVEWRDATPPIPIAKPALRRGDAHFFDPEAVAAWLRKRRANGKAWNPIDPNAAPREQDTSTADLRKVRALRERLRYEKEAGEVVSRREIIGQLQRTFNAIMLRGLRLPPHVAPILAATSEPDAVRRILEDEMRRLFIELASGGADLLGEADDEGGTL